jgi:hypothetical protein
MPKITPYKLLSIAASLLFLYLFYELFFCSTEFITSLGLKASDAIPILCRRTAMFMLGLSILLFTSSGLPASAARSYISFSTGITMLSLACMGTYEFLRGTVNSSILIAISIETIFGALFILTFLSDRKQSNTPNQALLPTPTSVTDRAGARSAPDAGAADL